MNISVLSNFKISLPWHSSADQLLNSPAVYSAVDLLERRIFYRCLRGCRDLAAAKLLVIFIVLIFAAVVVTTDSDFPSYRIHRNVRIPLALPEDRGWGLSR
jgi:hypothetical protein